ncbi:hypothetical protein ACOMHN_000698 [Nucella lapillus]
MVSYKGGNYCRRTVCRYRYRRVCRYRWWGRCCSWRTIREGYWVTESFCCPGWKHYGNQDCNTPICIPSCQNGGTCSSPGRCSCLSTHIGYRCSQAVCSYNAPCFPGTCQGFDSCDCASGFQTKLPFVKQNYCLKIEDVPSADVRLTEMQVRMSYWPRYANPPMELHWIMADSTALEQGQMDVYWTNRRDFNRLETTSTSQYFPPRLTDHPPYVSGHQFGIVDGQIEVWLKKLQPGSSGTAVPTKISLNATFPCQDSSISSTKPESNVYNCSVIHTDFDRFLEHRDALNITFKSTGGGFRQLYNPDIRRNLTKQSYEGVERQLSVEFRFDFLLPAHCNTTGTCSAGETMLSVPDITKNNPISITWKGWSDTDSQMDRYAWEVFTMSKTIDGGLEIPPARALSPLVNTEVMAANYTPQSFQLPGPGMYSVILEAGDLANNTIFCRRLVLYDPDPKITTDPDHELYVSSASQAAGYRYQNNLQKSIEVTWDRHFRNALHEENNLLGAVRRYPVELKDGTTNEGSPRFRKDIPPASKRDDHEGQRTVDAIPNKRAIVKFSVQHAKDHDGGRTQLQNPSGSWIVLGLATSYTVPQTPSLADTVTLWVKATDVMGTERVERTQVTFDTSPPEFTSPIQFRMNVPVKGIHFSSQFTVLTKDKESGIAYIEWTFTRQSNQSVMYRQRVPGASVSSCTDFTKCGCTTTKDCFSFLQVFSVSNCHMMVEKESLATEVIKVTADITNMAGLVTRLNMTKDDLTQLNGTEAYFPPQNISVTDITQGSVTVTWSFPPSCFPRTGLWVIVNEVKHAVHKDARSFALTGLEAGTPYTIYMVTDYTANEQSNKASVQFTTVEEDGLSVGAIIGIVIAFLLVALIVVLIVIFVLWRRGKVFQKEGTPVNKQLHKVSRAFDNVRKTVRGGKADGEMGAFQNNAYHAKSDPDEIYMYGSMAFNSRQAWQLDDSSLTLLDHVAEGRFATIYKATWTHQGKQDTVASKMLKAGFSEDDALKMMAKINFMATQLENHPNVIKFLGAVTDNQGWGPVLVMEYCETGQMDKWLARSKADMSEQVMENLFRFAHGIAKGMEYIASKKITHKRLAARNVLLNFLLEPKVAGFGPQNKEGAEDKAARVPAKWAAPEVLQEKPSTEKSDVWSYGVVLWEIFSMGQVPYPGIHAGEIGTRLKSGYRMEKPEFADDMHYDLMKLCWEYRQSKRPTFSSIRAQLDKLFSPASRQSNAFYYDTNQLNG